MKIGISCQYQKRDIKSNQLSNCNGLTEMKTIPLIQKSFGHEDIADDKEIEWKVFTKLRLILMINPNVMYILRHSRYNLWSKI